MILKDRYSYCFVWLLIMLFLFFYTIGNNQFRAASVVLLIGIFPLAILLNKSAKLHFISDSDKESHKGIIFYKAEVGCGFSTNEEKNLDGIYYNKYRYKLVNGSDFYLDSWRREIIPCGFGTRIMSYLGAGGKEPANIQNDQCWNV